MARTVTTPGGEVWQVRRLWAPRLGGERLWTRIRRRIRRAPEHVDVTSGADAGCLSDLFDEFFVVLAVVVVVALVVVAGYLLVFVLLDIVLVALLTVLALAARIVFRRPWVIEATSGDEIDGGAAGVAHRTWRVVGWRASGEAVDRIAEALAYGMPTPSAQENRVPGASPDLRGD
jgi:hypothetical protein